MNNRRRVLFIAIDAADKDLVTQWAEAGRLPTFRLLLESALSGVTINPPGLFVGATWPTLYTGVSPAKHARYCWQQIKPGAYEYESTKTGNFIQRRPFWEALGEAGKRCVIIDLPHTFPAELNGLQIVEWGAHDPSYGFMTWPPTLAAEIEQEFGIHPVRRCDQVRDTEGNAALQEKLLNGIDKKVELVGRFLEKESWDFFAVVFSESHCAGHQFWHVHDPNHPDHDPALRRELGDPVENVYHRLDGAVCDLLGRVGPETLAIVLCSHGMGPHYGGNFMLNEILLYLEKPEILERRRVGKPEPLWLRGKRKLSRLLGAEAGPPNSFAQRKCFAVPNNDAAGGIRINLAGREPQGKVRRGTEYEELCSVITKDLLGLRNPETREPVVREVYRTADRYEGEYLHHLPDLIVEWNRERPISSVWSPKFGQFSKKEHERRTGDHRPEGMLMARGPGVVARRLSPIDSRCIAPTIASYLGITLDGVDGTAIELTGT